MATYLEKIKMRIEPSTRLSTILGYPYFIEKSYTIQELLDNGIITEDDIKQMQTGKEIKKQIPVR